MKKPPKANMTLVQVFLSEIGRKGGKAKSDAKTAASRANAKLGGWPKGKPRKPKRARRAV